jgi:hypothetical protein
MMTRSATSAAVIATPVGEVPFGEVPFIGPVRMIKVSRGHSRQAGG